MNIACYVEGCNNSVIGQCNGYESSCGRFYCSEHSDSGLCEECAESREINAIIERYVEIADDIRKGIGGKKTVSYVYGIIPLLIGGPALLVIFLGAYPQERANAVVIALVSFSIMWFLIFVIPKQIDKRTRAKAIKIETDHEGFLEFYDWYVTQQNIEAKNLLVASAIGAVGAALVDASRNEQLEKSVRQSVRKEMDRRGY